MWIMEREARGRGVGVTSSNAIVYAFGAAALFGISTPLAKRLLGDTPPLMLAGVLYAGSGLGLTLWDRLRRSERGPLLPGGGWRYLVGAIAAGGVVAPVCLMMGLASTPASTSALLLNLESVFTTLIAWFGFKEHYDRRIAAGMLCFVAGSVWLSWNGSGLRLPMGSLLIAIACAGWALDNNLTQKVSAADPVRIAALKGVTAAGVNVTLAFFLGQRVASVGDLGGALLVGFLGYGFSLVLFVLALRHLGTARTGAYFSTAPFLGAVASFVLTDERVSAAFVGGAALMALGVYLHLTERHNHEHEHDSLEHEHLHQHDEHHQHPHSPGADPRASHTHWHRHVSLRHSHPHYPDIHHRHEHDGTPRSGPDPTFADRLARVSGHAVGSGATAAEDVHWCADAPRQVRGPSGAVVVQEHDHRRHAGHMVMNGDDGKTVGPECLEYNRQLALEHRHVASDHRISIGAREGRPGVQSHAGVDERTVFAHLEI